MTNILLVGCGKMGSAMLRGWGDDPSLTIHIVTPSPKTETGAISWVASPDMLPKDFVPAIVILAIKPQMMPSLLPAYARYQSSLFLSIAAGTTLDKLAQILGMPHTPIIRAMPNLPGQIGKGITAVCANAHVTQNQKDMAQQLLESLGPVVWMTDETHMDAVTALSGSGPAYVFALCEAMEKAGLALGLLPEHAAQLARQTIAGSGDLLAKSCATAEELRRAVTSPGGTTEAALKILCDETNGLHTLLAKAMTAAHTRAKEL